MKIYRSVARMFLYNNASSTSINSSGIGGDQYRKIFLKMSVIRKIFQILRNIAPLMFTMGVLKFNFSTFLFNFLQPVVKRY